MSTRNKRERSARISADDEADRDGGAGRSLRSLDRLPRFGVRAAMSPVDFSGRKPDRNSELMRMVATAGLVMPASKVRLSANPPALGREAQILCLLTGANSVFYHDTLLTTSNAHLGEDENCSRRSAGRYQQTTGTVEKG